MIPRFLFIARGTANVSRKVVERLGLSYRTTKELNNIIDTNLPGPPPFECRELSIGHEKLQFFCRDALQCIRTLYGNPEFRQDLVFAPERHYTDDDRKCRIVNEMYTGDWWWDLQVRKTIYGL
jgi:Plavaka transposase